MTNEEIYRNEINYNNDYKVSLMNFTDWLYDHNSARKAYSEIIKKFAKNGFTDEDLYFVAVDYSIPIAMVKWFIMINRKYLNNPRVAPLFF
jgi:hypothetical protein